MAKTADRFGIGSAASRNIALFAGISNRVKPIPEIEFQVEHLAKAHPLAVGANAEAYAARALLHTTELLHHFDHMVTVTDGLKPKPSPAQAIRLPQTPIGSPYVSISCTVRTCGPA